MSSQTSVVEAKEGGTSQSRKWKPPAEDMSQPENIYQQVTVSVWLSLIASIVSAPFLFGFDLMVIGSIQPRIIQDLGQIEKFAWITVAYVLANMSTTLLWGRLYTIFNIKYCFLASILIFEAGSAISGAAPDMNVLIGGRVLSGVGAMGSYLGAMNMMAVITTIQQRPLYISLMTIAYGLSTVIAPLVGAAFTDSGATWRWAFYINICICGVFVPGYLLLLPSKSFSLPTMTFSERFKRLDVLGNILWTGFTISGIMAISFGGTLYPWGSGQIIGLFVCFGVTTILFCVQQHLAFLVPTGFTIFPTRFIRSFEMCLLFVQVAASTAVITVVVILIPLYFEFARGSSAVRASVHLLPIVILRSVCILVNGFFMPRFGYALPWYLFGAALCLAGSAPLLVVTLETTPAKIYGYCVLIGSGVGLFNQASFAVAQARTTPSLVPQAVSFIMAGQVVGATASLTIFNTIFLNRSAILVGSVLDGVTKDTIQQALLGGLSTYLTHNASPQQQQRVLGAIVTAIDEAWAPIVAATALSTIAAIFMKRDRLFQVK